MSVTEASDSDMQVKINLNDKQSKNGDEQIEGMSVSDMPEFCDPAILVAREIRKRYTIEELHKLREAPLSQKKPDFFDTAEISLSIFDPDKWNLDRKKPEAAPENGPRTGDTADHRRRPGDPRERIRKENDGIVLSPQRRSFNSGCFVPVRDTTRTNRPHSPLGGSVVGNTSGGPKETPHIAVREIQPGTRRIGSGRIVRDWDYNEKAADSGENDFSYNRGGQPQRNNNNNNNEREDRRSFNFDMKEKDTRRTGRYNDRRHHRDEEPEWFSSGPISQNDTIELRGFDEPEKAATKKKMAPSRVKRYKEWGATEGSAGGSKSSPSPQVGNGEGDGQPRGPKGKEDGKQGGEQMNLFDDFFTNSIPGLLPNGDGGDANNAKSRSSLWFKRESPQKMDGRNSSIQENHHIIKDILNDIGETKVAIPGDSESYFAPISPAANTGKHDQQGFKMDNIMSMLQGGAKKTAEHSGHNLKPPAGKILSLDELESKIRNAPADNISALPPKHQHKQHEDIAAFNKLIQSLSGPKTQGMSLMEMLNDSQQQDEARAQMIGSASPNLTNLHNAAAAEGDLAQQQKIEMFNKMMNAASVHSTMRTSPNLDIGLQQSRELLNRPEAKAILQGLQCGSITTQHLYQQLSNPALQHRHREILTSILKMQGGAGGGLGPSPRLSPVPPHHLYQPQQQLRVSPLQANAMHQRIPSPSEMRVLTQNILQRALIKKKLEEQQENFRKKQEMQRGQSPNTNNNQSASKSVSSPTQFTFTPTSVLRKMTADKDEGKENKGLLSDRATPQGRPLTGMKVPQQVPQWNPQQYSMKQPIGRPIVKANTTFPQQMTQNEQFLFQQQQHRLYNQQQQPQQQQQQQRKSTQSNQFLHGANNGSNAPSHHNQYPTNQQFPQQLTQQQLRAQHQQHARPVTQSSAQQPAVAQSATHLPSMPQQQQTQQPMGAWQQFFNNAQQNNRNNPLSRGGSMTDGDLTQTTTNQLAQWFSPDLLERARGGELPSTAGLGLHALSLEEIERQTAPPVHN